MKKFELVSSYQPQGDQPRAIQELNQALDRGQKFQTLLGVTGSGKTFSMANVIQHYQKPTLIISHNKTLAAQLYGEFKSFFPDNEVEFFISYYDYYQPEAYIPGSDKYIEKDMSINDEIDRLRLKATSSLLEREDVIIIASVSCIYGIGSPEEYRNQMVAVEKGMRIQRNDFLSKLVNIYYTRNDVEFTRGTFRVRGDVVEVYPAYEDKAIRIELFGDEVENITIINTLTGEIQEKRDRLIIYPAKLFVTSEENRQLAIQDIRRELSDRLRDLRKEGKLLEAQRLEQRTNYDIEMMIEVGYCSGIENYSRHISRRKPGERPAVLLDFFPKDFLMFIDESHQTIPQVQGMYNGDRSRKQTLVDYGFRLPSALDNRPLKFNEFESMIHRCIFVSATPSEYEIKKGEGILVEQIIRPTGLMDPEIEVRPIKGQIDDLINEIQIRAEKKERVLITTLTKRMAEDLTDYLQGIQIRVRYLHSEIDALERVNIIRDLRLAEFDVLVGINLLREGLDLPEVSLVAVLDADKEGFLRSQVALMQTAGRAARNIAGKVIFYADRITNSMKSVIQETKRRRKLQMEYNRSHGITPRTIYKTTEEVMSATAVADSFSARVERIAQQKKATQYLDFEKLAPMGTVELIQFLEKEMKAASKNMEFEKAAEIRDEILKIKTEIPGSKRSAARSPKPFSYKKRK